MHRLVILEGIVLKMDVNGVDKPHSSTKSCCVVLEYAVDDR
jgi:hypothetical protein